MKTSNKAPKKMLEKKESKSLIIPQTEENSVSKCYVCNQNVSTSTGMGLLNSKLPISSGSIPQKIVKIMGEDCMVLVSVEDYICSKCVNLFNKLDRLEIEVTKILDEITNYLNLKYNISSSITISSSSQLTPPLKRGLKRKYPSNDTFENLPIMQPEVEKQLSEMFGSPVTVTTVNNKTQTKSNGQKQKNIKNNLLFKCPICREGFNDKSLLHFHITDSHLSKHKCNTCLITFKDEELLKKHLSKNNCTNQSTNNASPDSLFKKFKCAICSQKFETKELLNTHLKKHKTAYFKCGSCGETFKKRDLLMKHLELHTKNKSIDNKDNNQTVEESSSNSNQLKSAKEIKFLDCKSCALSYIDNDHYSSHLNSAHRKPKSDNIKTVKEEKIDTNLNQIDLETIFEKLHSDSVIGSTDNTNQENVIDLLPENLNKKTDEKTTIISSNKVYLYKCPGCSGLYDNSNDLQLHILTAGHVDYNSEIQILEVDNSDNIITNSDKITNSTDNEIHLLEDKDSSTNNEIKIISLDDNCDSNNIQFITSDEGGEIKFITFHSDNSGDVRLLSPEEVDSSIKFVDLSNSEQASRTTNIYNINDQSTSNKEIQELFQSVVVDSSSLPAMNNNTTSNTISERSKIQIIDEKTIDISQFINISKKSMSRQNFQLNDLCSLPIKSEIQPNSQITPNILPQIVPVDTNTDIKTMLSSSMDLKETLMYTSQRKIYKCCRCEFKCLTHETIKAHMTKHNENKITDQYSNEQSQINQHDYQITTSIDKETSSTVAGIVNETNDLDCKICKQTFKSLNLLKRHNNAFHREPICTYCNKQMKNLHILRIHEQSHIRAGDVCVCDDCGKQFKTKCGLYNHRPVHTGNYKLFCEFCNRGFMSKVVLEEHRSKHTKEERFVCDICGKKFQFKSTYWIHRKWHDNPYPYKCNYCNRKFRHTSLLAVHKRKHTGERPYECPHCKQTFAVSGTLKCHLILHTGVYPFTCEICQRGFTTRHKFAVHLSKTHGDSNLLNNKVNDKQNNFKMVIKEIEHNEQHLDNETWSNKTQDINNTNLESLIDNNLINESTEVGSNETVKCNESSSTSILNNWYDDENSAIIASLVDS